MSNRRLIPIHLRKPKSHLSLVKTTCALAGLLVLIACGGGSGDTASNQTNRLEPQSLNHLSDAELQRSASTGSQQMRAGMNRVQRFSAMPEMSDSINDASAVELFSQLLGMSGRSDFDSSASAADQVNMDSENADVNHHNNQGWASSDTNELVDITLGLMGNADITRDGNRVLVNPDDQALCGHDAIAVHLNAEESLFCLAMVADLRIRIDGQTPDAGSIHYLYQQEPLLSIDYAPNKANYALNLPGLNKVLRQAYALAPQEFDTIPDRFEGVIELAVNETTDKQGLETGSINLAITSPIAIEDQAAGAGMHLAASNLLYFESTESLGTASLEMDAGAASYYFTDGNRIELASNGSSVKIDLFDDGDRISVTKLGLGKGPLTVTLDSVEVVRVTLENFGFDVDMLSRQLMLTGQLDFNLMVNLVSEYFGESEGSLDLGLSVKAPTKATFIAVQNGAIKLDQAGPFNIDWYANFGEQLEQGSFSAQQGECFTEDNDGNALFSIVVCE